MAVRLQPPQPDPPLTIWDVAIVVGAAMDDKRAAPPRPPRLSGGELFPAGREWEFLGRQATAGNLIRGLSRQARRELVALVWLGREPNERAWRYPFLIEEASSQHTNAGAYLSGMTDLYEHLTEGLRKLGLSTDYPGWQVVRNLP